MFPTFDSSLAYLVYHCLVETSPSPFHDAPGWFLSCFGNGCVHNVVEAAVLSRKKMEVGGLVQVDCMILELSSWQCLLRADACSKRCGIQTSTILSACQSCWPTFFCEQPWCLWHLIGRQGQVDVLDIQHTVRLIFAQACRPASTIIRYKCNEIWLDAPFTVFGSLKGFGTA